MRWEHLNESSPPLEIGVRSQESGEKSQKEEGRSQKKCFYKYEMLPVRSYKHTESHWSIDHSGNLSSEVSKY
ncbi:MULTISPECIES: hypothetical protein [unclassified Microcoleus]|uniref:hypothetical protein n=1 Tax=unclassified Microcoleus TaxID=2642155 RepID=UPI002FD55534